MTCTQIDELMAASLDAPLAAGDQAAVDAHLATCASCVRRMQGYVLTVETLRSLGPVEAAETPAPVPEALVRRILASRAAVAHRRDEGRRIG